MVVFDPNALMMGPRSLGSVNGETTATKYNGKLLLFKYTCVGPIWTRTEGGLRITSLGEIVSAKLLEQKMDELGITVTDDELLDMVYGENPDLSPIFPT